MKMKALVLGFLLWVTIPALAIAADTPLNCVTGPLEKTFGNTPWLVYSCDDRQTLIVITASGSPATPFVFSFYKKDGAYQLHGEGTGRKDLTDAAYKELGVLTEARIKALIQQTHSVRAK